MNASNLLVQLMLHAIIRLAVSHAYPVIKRFLGTERRAWVSSLYKKETMYRC